MSDYPSIANGSQPVQNYSGMGSLGMPAYTPPAYNPSGGLQQYADTGSELGEGAATVAKDTEAGSIVPGIGTAIGAAVGLGQAALQWYDDTQNRKAQQSAQAQQLQLYNQAQAEDTRRYNAQLNMSQVNQQDQLKNSAQNRQLNQQNMNLKQEQSQETMMANYINRLMGFANSPSTRGIFNGLWGKK